MYCVSPDLGEHTTLRPGSPRSKDILKDPPQARKRDALQLHAAEANPTPTSPASNLRGRGVVGLNLTWRGGRGVWGGSLHGVRAVGGSQTLVGDGVLAAKTPGLRHKKDTAIFQQPT